MTMFRKKKIFLVRYDTELRIIQNDRLSIGGMGIVVAADVADALALAQIENPLADLSSATVMDLDLSKPGVIFHDDGIYDVPEPAPRIVL